MSKPICNKCGLEMSVSKVGVPIIYMFSNPPVPYRLRYGDKWECPLCKTEIINGLSERGAEHYQDTFKKEIEQIKKSGESLTVWEHIKDVPSKQSLT